MSKRKVSDDELTDQEIVDNDSNESSKKKYPCMVQKWTKEEDEKLIKLVEKYNSSKKTNWNLIAKHIAGRNFMQCRSRWDLKFNPKYILLSWTSDEDKKLIDLVGKLGENWEEISKQMNGRTNRQCRDRWLNKLTPKYVVGSWTSEEDEKLTSLIKKYGTKWAQISTLMNGRTPKQCRVRWVKHVDPEIDRGIWTIEEDNRLMELVTKLGPNWARISEIISKRTYDQCRNRWIYTLCPDFSKECWTFLEDEKLVKFVKKYGKDWPKISKLLKNRNYMQCRKRWNSMVLSDPSLKTIELPETSSSNSNEIKDKNKGGSSQKKKKKKQKKVKKTKKILKAHQENITSPEISQVIPETNAPLNSIPVEMSTTSEENVSSPEISQVILETNAPFNIITQEVSNAHKTNVTSLEISKVLLKTNDLLNSITSEIANVQRENVTSLKISSLKRNQTTDKNKDGSSQKSKEKKINNSNKEISKAHQEDVTSTEISEVIPETNAPPEKNNITAEVSSTSEENVSSPEISENCSDKSPTKVVNEEKSNHLIDSILLHEPNECILNYLNGLTQSPWFRSQNKNQTRPILNFMAKYKIK